VAVAVAAAAEAEAEAEAEEAVAAVAAVVHRMAATALLPMAAGCRPRSSLTGAAVAVA